MKNFHLIRSLASATSWILLAAPIVADSGRVSATRLRCEALVDPLGIGSTTPRLDWVASSEDRGQRQVAHQVVVASTRDRAERLQADLWDSGTTKAGFGSVAYKGKELRFGDDAYWRVRVQDRDGVFGPWSEVARFTIGPLSEDNWAAEWIGYDDASATEPEHADFGAARRIARRFPSDGPPSEGQAGEYFLARDWRLPEGLQIESAVLLVTADDSCGFAINGMEVAHPIFPDQPMQVDVRPYLHAGINRLRARVANAAAGPTGLAARLVVRSKAGEELELLSDGEWGAASVAPEPSWATAERGAFDEPAANLGGADMSPWGAQTLKHLTTAPASYLRRDFEAESAVTRATLSVATLGWADVSLNGRVINEDFFSSGWTDYTKRVYCRTYDVTDQIESGGNSLGVVLSPGWYGGHIGWKGKRDHYGSKPRVRLLLRLEYDDGRVETVGTDNGWRASLGPITATDILVGEEYDARRELGPWDSVGYDAAGWEPVSVGGVDAPPIEPHPGPPVVIVEEFPTKSIAEPAPGVYVFDLGQNFAGVVRLNVNGGEGQRLQLRYGERLNEDGTLYHTNMRYARATDFYTCRGGGNETWVPRHTFHGFQYVEVTGLDKTPSADLITGLALSSDTPLAGSFTCSEPMLNQLTSNILWTQRANFIDVPTDCPQRDERLGWTGDAQVYVNAACLNADSQAFFSKWLIDLVDAQRDDGQFPMVAPLKVAEGDGGPAWADAGVICPMAIYDHYGDIALLERQYPSMKRFVDFCWARSRDGGLAPETYHCFGDWLSIKADTPKDVIYTAYLARSTALLARAAEALGRESDAARYRELFETAKTSFNRAYVGPDGLVEGDTQCAYALAITCDLLDETSQVKAGRRLAADIADRGGRLSTGFVGTKDLMFALSRVGRADLAHRLLHSNDFPGWGFSIQHGATSIWERWDGWTADNGFQSAGMNSFAHYSFGAVYHWMVEHVGGIRRDAVGYERVVIRPDFAPAIDWAKTRYDSVRGTIATDWTRGPDRLRLRVEVPCDVTAEVHLPADRLAQVLEGGGLASSAQGVRMTRLERGQAVIVVGSGEYDFEAPVATTAAIDPGGHE